MFSTLKVVKSPSAYSQDTGRIKIFLAGSIEGGKADNWQIKIEKRFKDFDFMILNPRRDDWDTTQEERIRNEQFLSQVEWEHNALCDSDIIAMYFDANTKSPISLLELGLFAPTGKLVVCCPDGFWKKGNVEFICKEYNIPLMTDFEEFCTAIIVAAHYKSSTKYKKVGG